MEFGGGLLNRAWQHRLLCKKPWRRPLLFFLLFSNVFSELNIFQGSASASARHIRFSSPVATVAHGAAPTRCVPGVPSNAPAQRPEWMSSRNCKLLETLIGECTNQHEPTNCNRPNKQNTSTKQTEH